jgi:hypothetical protein
MSSQAKLSKVDPSAIDTESIKQTTLKYLESQYGVSTTGMDSRFYADLSQASGREAIPPSEADLAEIRAMALDYIEGWYEGDVVRVERSLHPDLARRIVLTDPTHGVDRLDQISAMGMVQLTRCCFGNVPEAQQQKDITILDVFGNAASLKVEANDWIDYIHAAKFNGKWVIINILWELK